MTESRADAPTSRPGGGRVRLLHLSDPHLFGDGTLHYGVVDSTAALVRVLDAASDVSDIDAVVLSGDLTDDGTPAAYRKLQGMIEPWAAARGAEVAYVMGNHDVRAGFEEVLGERTGSVTVGGLRIVRLDSSVPDRGYGEIDAAQLDWLRRELAADSAPTVVLLHHPPTPGMTPLLAGLQLQNPGALLDICSQAGVLAILAGHYHHALVTAERGIPLVVAPGITNTTDIHAPAGREQARIGSGFAVVDIPFGGPGGDAAPRLAPRVTVHAAPGPDDGQLIFDLSDDEVAAITAKAGPTS
jgi:3',5'-cyclic AMP phosphodiesterase CpdA